jgi:hypothetical protein
MRVSLTDPSVHAVRILDAGGKGKNYGSTKGRIRARRDPRRIAREKAMSQSEGSRFRVRKRWIGLGGLLVLVGAYVGIRCIPPARFKAVNRSGGGPALNERVAVVYSNQYPIRLAGPENPYPPRPPTIDEKLHVK